MITGFPAAVAVAPAIVLPPVLSAAPTLVLTASSGVLTPFGSAGVTLPAATVTAAGLLDAPRATIVDALPVMPLATVAKSGLYTDLIGQPTTLYGISFIIDGGGVAITTGLKGFLIFSYSATITKWAIIADQSGSISVDIWKANGAIPVLANSITGGNPPLLTASQFTGLATPVNWSTLNIIPNDVMGFNVSSTGGVIQRVTLALQITHL